MSEEPLRIWYNRMLAAGIVILLVVLPCQADNNTSTDNSVDSSTFYDFLIDNSSELVTCVDDIEYNQNEWNVVQNWAEKGKTKAWIDIVGYNGLIQYNGTIYINTPHTNAAYILYGTGHTVGGKYSFDSLNAGITNRSYDGNTVTGTLGTTLKYHWTRKKCHTNINGERKCKKKTTRYTKENVFTQTDEYPPSRYPSYIPVENVSVVIYNNSIRPKTIIDLPPVNYSLGYRIQYDNESVEYYHNVLRIEYKANLFPVGNVTPAESNSIYDDSDMFSRIGNRIVLNSTEMNDSLNLYLITPYGEQELNYTLVNGTKEYKLENAQLTKAFSLLMGGWFFVFIINYYKRWV